MESLSPDQLQYHQEVIKNLSKALAVKEHWFNHLALKHTLQEGDFIDEDGFITRASTSITKNVYH